MQENEQQEGITKRTVIRSGKIKGVHLTGEFDLYIPGNRKFEDSRESDGIIHEDLKNAFKKLVPHLILICDIAEAIMLQEEINSLVKHGIVDEIFNTENYSEELQELLKNINVNSFHIDGEEGEEKVTFSGVKYKGMKTMKLATISVGLNENDYQYAEELAMVLEEVKAEVYEYLFNQKEAMKQLEVDFEEAEVGEQSASNS